MQVKNGRLKLQLQEITEQLENQTGKAAQTLALWELAVSTWRRQYYDAEEQRDKLQEELDRLCLKRDGESDMIIVDEARLMAERQKVNALQAELKALKEQRCETCVYALYYMDTDWICARG